MTQAAIYRSAPSTRDAKNRTASRELSRHRLRRRNDRDYSTGTMEYEHYSVFPRASKSSA